MSGSSDMYTNLKVMKRELSSTKHLFRMRNTSVS